MVTSERVRLQRGRKATWHWLRALAALVALVLSASSLGQAAHFLLVPHTICAEHGELLELGEESHGASEREGDRADDDHGPTASQPELSVAHDHCQVLARGQREQALPEAAPTELLPAASAVKTTVFEAPRATVSALERLALAPKTSPPRSPSC